MEAQSLPDLQRRLARGDYEAWQQFLRDYSPVILQVIQTFERDADTVADCFLFVSQKLSEKSFRRLRKFRAEGPAKFTTWLRAVVRNLCLDWHRHEFGRHRVFEVIGRLSPFDQAVFRTVFEQGYPADTAFLLLQPQFPQATPEACHASAEQIDGLLNSRQRWLLAARRGCAAEPVEWSEEVTASSHTNGVADDPEELYCKEENLKKLRHGITQLNPQDQVLIRLRYEQGLTLQEVARAAGLKSPQEADRRIRELLVGLRTVLGVPFKPEKGEQRP